jgi:hypothetical protein
MLSEPKQFYFANKTLKANGFRPLFSVPIIACGGVISGPAKGGLADGYFWFIAQNAAWIALLSSRQYGYFGHRRQYIVSIYILNDIKCCFRAILRGVNKKSIPQKLLLTKEVTNYEECHSYSCARYCGFRCGCRCVFRARQQSATGGFHGPPGGFRGDASTGLRSFHLQYPWRRQVEVVDPPNVVGKTVFCR